jgi:hypothetical protein
MNKSGLVGSSLSKEYYSNDNVALAVKKYNAVVGLLMSASSL